MITIAHHGIIIIHGATRSGGYSCAETAQPPAMRAGGGGRDPRGVAHKHRKPCANMRHSRTVSSVYGLIIRADADTRCSGCCFAVHDILYPDRPPHPLGKSNFPMAHARARTRSVGGLFARRAPCRLHTGSAKAGNAERVLSCQRHFNETAIRNRQHLAYKEQK